jgi:pyruvate dehydrogenase (quinone)
VAKADELEDALRAAFGHDGRPWLTSARPGRSSPCRPSSPSARSRASLTRTILSSDGEELVELAKTNLRELAAE